MYCTYTLICVYQIQLKHPASAGVAHATAVHGKPVCGCAFHSDMTSHVLKVCK